MLKIMIEEKERGRDSYHSISYVGSIVDDAA